MFLGNILLFVFILILGIVSYNTTKQLVYSFNWVNHTYEAMLNATIIKKNIIDLETGERGFLITGKANLFIIPKKL